MIIWSISSCSSVFRNTGSDCVDAGDDRPPKEEDGDPRSGIVKVRLEEAFRTTSVA